MLIYISSRTTSNVQRRPSFEWHSIASCMVYRGNLCTISSKSSGLSPLAASQYCFAQYSLVNGMPITSVILYH